MLWSRCLVSIWRIVSTYKPIRLPQWGRLYSNQDVSLWFQWYGVFLMSSMQTRPFSSCPDEFNMLVHRYAVYGWGAHNPRGTPTLMGRISKTRALLIDSDVATFQYTCWNKVNKSHRRFIASNFLRLEFISKGTLIWFVMHAYYLLTMLTNQKTDSS